VARTPVEEARLQAVAAAKRVHRALDLHQRVADAGGQVDVFDVIAELDIALIFKPLKSALGLCLPQPLRGIMVTTERSLHIQRITAAHELGHVILEHRGSIDLEILERGPFGPSQGRDIQEVEAEAFAAEFLLPRWLYRHHVQAQGWSLAHLRNPEIVYQLSLRMGASYEATCWGLLGHQILPRGDVDALRKAKVATLKLGLGEEFRPADSWADVWKVTDRDDGATISGNPDDLIRVELDEAVGSGFRWNAEALGQAGYEVLADSSSFSRDPLLYGAPARRVLIARAPGPGATKLVLRETQPWREAEDDDPVFAVELALHGKEKGGPARADWRRRGVAR
jgi:Zn-dependent peptidase ImmA (M78 family)